MLPNGSELVVGVGRKDHYFLYDARAWQSREWVINLPISYEIDPAGRIINGAGHVTPWLVKDLKDTEQTLDKGC